MTSSRDSLIPDTKPRSEAEARIEAALSIARKELPEASRAYQLDSDAGASLALDLLKKIIAILDGGKS